VAGGRRSGQSFLLSGGIHCLQPNLSTYKSRTGLGRDRPAVPSPETPPTFLLLSVIDEGDTTLNAEPTAERKVRRARPLAATTRIESTITVLRGTSGPGDGGPARTLPLIALLPSWEGGTAAAAAESRKVPDRGQPPLALPPSFVMPLEVSSCGSSSLPLGERGE